MTDPRTLDAIRAHDEAHHAQIATLLAEIERLRAEASAARDEFWTRIDAMQAQTDLDGCAIDRLNTENVELRAQVAALRKELDGWKDSAAMACECPPAGCDCPGCSLARDTYGGGEVDDADDE